MRATPTENAILKIILQNLIIHLSMKMHRVKVGTKVEFLEHLPA